MNNHIKTITLSLTATAIAAPAWAHSGPGAHHDFGLLQSLEHIFTSPDHLAKVVLTASLLGVVGLAIWRSRVNGRDIS